MCTHTIRTVGVCVLYTWRGLERIGSYHACDPSRVLQHMVRIEGYVLGTYSLAIASLVVLS